MQQKPVREKPGLTLTDPNRIGDIAEYTVIHEALKRGAEVYKNVGCSGKTDIIISTGNSSLHVDVKTEKWDYRNQSFVSSGVQGATTYRVLVNPETYAVRWVKGKAPQGWENFWD